MGGEDQQGVLDLLLSLSHSLSLSSREKRSAVESVSFEEYRIWPTKKRLLFFMGEVNSSASTVHGECCCFANFPGKGLAAQVLEFHFRIKWRYAKRWYFRALVGCGCFAVLTGMETESSTMDSGQQRLQDLGYKQELKRDLSYANFVPFTCY